MKKNIFKLSVLDVRLWVRLGCSETEKAQRQMISLNLDIDYHTCPEGVPQDDIKGIVCYAELVHLITAHCQSKSFNTIEYLGQSVHQAITDHLSASNHPIESVKIEAYKTSPPVPTIHGGVKWTHHVIEEKA